MVQSTLDCIQSEYHAINDLCRETTHHQMVLLKELTYDRDLLACTLRFYFSLMSFFCISSQDNRISLVDYVVSYYLHNVDKVQVNFSVTDIQYFCDFVCFNLLKTDAFILSSSEKVVAPACFG